MNLARRIAVAASALALTLVAVAPAMAQLTQEPAKYFGKLRLDALNNNSTWAPGPVTDATGDVYDNTTASPNFGFSLTDLSAIMGDRVSTTGTGLLAANDFSVFNSSSSAGPLLTATYVISFFDGASNALIGNYAATLNFGTGLPPGFFAIVSITNLIPAGITLNTQDVLITQQAADVSGGANRIGIASLDPPTVGSSANTMFINSVQVGPAGYYTLGNPAQNANPGYRINVSTTVPAERGSWGHLKALYH